MLWFIKYIYTMAKMNTNKLIWVFPESRKDPKRIDAVVGEKTDVKGFFIVRETVT
jgi:hypothetical protein